jgi:hypothetical protein
MARFFWYTLGLAAIAAVVAGASWAIAYNTVNDVLGAPPPMMGKQRTTFLWEGMPRVAGHPRAWRFAFGPTRIPGAPNVTIYVSPTGRLLQTEPKDLANRVKAMHKGFN